MSDRGSRRDRTPLGAAPPSRERERPVKDPALALGARRGCRTFAHGRSARLRASQPGFSLAETVISLVLVGGLLAVALTTVGASSTGRAQSAQRTRGHTLALDLMSEILSQEYEDPDITGGERTFAFDQQPVMPSSPPLGRDSGESGGDRSTFDDVDDYDAWTASPPERKDGTVIPNLSAWRRSVTVVWVDPQDLTQTSLLATGVKEITVAVTRNDVPVAELTTLKTVGLPPPNDSVRVLLVVTDPASLAAQESARQALMQSWGFGVDLIAASDSLGQFVAAVVDADVAYVPEDTLGTDLMGKLRDAAIGVVNEDWELVYEFGFASAVWLSNESEIWIDDASHYITSGYSPDLLTIFSSSQPVFTLYGWSSVDLQTVAWTHTTGPDYYPSLAVFEEGALLYGGGTAQARRVQLPWGDTGFDINALNADGQTIMQRAIEWAAGADGGGAPLPATVCGNGLCEAGEDCYGCPGDCASRLGGKPKKRYCCGDGTLQSAEGDGTICDGNP